MMFSASRPHLTVNPTLNLISRRIKSFDRPTKAVSKRLLRAFNFLGPSSQLKIKSPPWLLAACQIQIRREPAVSEAPTWNHGQGNNKREAVDRELHPPTPLRASPCKLLETSFIKNAPLESKLCKIRRALSRPACQQAWIRPCP